MIKKIFKEYLKDLALEDSYIEGLAQNIENQLAHLKNEYEYTTLRKEELKGKSVLFATPCYGGQILDVHQSSMERLLKECEEYGIRARSMRLSNESLVQRGRNALVNDYLNSDYDHLMFIDADIGFPPEAVFQLLQLDVPISGGPYSKKTIKWEQIKKAAQNGVPAEELPYWGGEFAVQFLKGAATRIETFKPLPVSAMGTGFMLIKREVFEQFMTQFPQTEYYNNHHYQPLFSEEKQDKFFHFFHCEPDPETNNQYLSEDYWFCKKVREMNIDVILAPWIHLIHRGTFSFKGDLVNSLSVSE